MPTDTPTSTPLSGDQNIAPIEDTYVRNGEDNKINYATINYGSEPILILKDGSDKFDRHAFIKFALNDVQGPVARAILKLTVTGLPNGAPAPLKLYTVADGWSEHELTWNNQPAFESLLGEATISATGEIQFDITDYVNAQIANDRVVSVVLIDNTTARRMIRFWSREGQLPPVLQLTMN